MPETVEAVVCDSVVEYAFMWSIDQVRAATRAEQLKIDALLEAGPRYVSRTDDQRIPIVHASSCFSIRSHVDLIWGLEQKARMYGTDLLDIVKHGYGPSTRLPLLSRSEVEALPRYRTCHMCSPTLDHGLKIDAEVEQQHQDKQARGQAWSHRKCKYLDAGVLGHWVEDEIGTPLGVLFELTFTHSAHGSFVSLLFSNDSWFSRHPDDRLWFSKTAAVEYELIGGSPWLTVPPGVQTATHTQAVHDA